MNTRLQQFLNAENITQAQFADSIGVARAGVSHIIAGRNNPGYDFIINTMNRYPDLNIEWLLTGRGKMYKGSVVREENPALRATYEQNAASDLNFEGNPNSTVFDFGSAEQNPDPQNEIHPPLNRGDLSQGRLFSPDNTDATPQTQSLPSQNQQVAKGSALNFAPNNAARNEYSQQYMDGAGNTEASRRVKISKIIVFFEDGTFQECQ